MAEMGSAVLGFVMSLVSVVTVVGNIAVLLSYYLDKNIRQPSNYFIFSLALSDLLIGLEGIPVYTAFYLNDLKWQWGPFMCDLWLSVDYIVCLASIYTVLGITIDRYCSVIRPATYRNWRTHRRIVLVILVIWTVPSVLFSVSIFGYGTFTGKGRILDEKECYVQFMTNPYLNMGMYISYYWTTLFVMLYLYWGIYRAAKKLALKSDQKTKRLALLTEMRKPEYSIRTSDAGNSSSDSPNDTSNSSKYYKAPPPTTTNAVPIVPPQPPPSAPVVNTTFRNHMTLHNNCIDHTKTTPPVVKTPSRQSSSTPTPTPTPSPSQTLAKSTKDDDENDDDEGDGAFSNPNFTSDAYRAFWRQEPSSVIERESTAPCCSPEPSQSSEPQTPSSPSHRHFGPQVSLPFIDAESISSLVGHDDLRRALSIRSRSRTFGSECERLTLDETTEKTLDDIDEKTAVFEEAEEEEQQQQHFDVPNGDVVQEFHQIEDIQPRKKRFPEALGSVRGYDNILTLQVQPSTSTDTRNNDERESAANGNECEVKVPLIAVSRVESVKNSAQGKVRRLLTVMRSRSIRRKRKRSKKEYKSRSENRARKALRTITFILGSFIILWTPFYVLATIYGFCDSCKQSASFNSLYVVSYYLCYMNSPLNPFCYAMANQQFKKTLTRIFKGDFRRV